MRLPVVIAMCLSLTGCQTGVGTNLRILPVAALSNPTAIVAASQAGALAPIGTLAGRVGRFDGSGFQPLAGARVALGDAGPETVSDPQGYYGFAHVTPGVHQLQVAEPGSHPALLAVRVGSLAGVTRANLAVVPQERAGNQPTDEIAVAGVVLDPRGAALPGGTVRMADSLTASGNHTATADGDGFYVLRLEGLSASALRQGTATLTAFGTTPGGVKVESTEALTLTLGGSATVAAAATTQAFSAPRDLRWVDTASRRRVLTGSDLPTRRDELVLRLSGPVEEVEIMPTAIEGGNVTLDVPPGYESEASLGLLPLGLMPLVGNPPSLPL